MRRRRKTGERKNSGSAVSELEFLRKKKEKKRKSPGQLQRHIYNLGRREKKEKEKKEKKEKEKKTSRFVFLFFVFFVFFS